MVKHLPGEIEKTVEDKLSKRIALRDRLETEKKYWQQYRDDEKEKAKQMVAGIDLGCGYWKPPEKPKAKQHWVAVKHTATINDITFTAYYFHCPTPDEGKPRFGQKYLYSASIKDFIKVTDPETALLIQQLLNDGTLTVKVLGIPYEFTNETNK